MPNKPSSLGSSQYHKLPYTENLDDYRPGGYHPVLLGDSFKNGRYVILNKLGYGGASTVWLAHDKLEDQCIALSIIMSEGPRGTVERQLGTLRHLAQGPADHPGRRNILIPLDEFEISGPNGRHTCFVTTVMGQSISVATKRAQGIASRVLPLGMAKRAVNDLAQAVAYMSTCGVVHGDLHPGNLLLSLSDDDSHGVEEIRSICGPPRTAPVARADGQAIPGNVPRYGVEAAFEREFDPSVFSGHIKVADFGDAFFQDQPPEQTSDLGPYVLPEYTSPQLMSISIDVWLLGCAMYQIVSGHDLFGVPDDPASLVVSRFSEALGKPPDFLIEDWKRRMKDLPVLHDYPTQPLSKRVRELIEGSQLRGMKDRRQEFRDADAKKLETLLEVVLVYDPERRPSIQEVLKHPAMEYFRIESTA